MELFQLEHFLKVAQTENVTKAAEELHISQPALSKTIRRLEKDLGVDLFDRGGKSIVLNDYGRLTATYAERIFRDINELRQKLSSFDVEHTGHVVLATSFPGRAPKWLNDCVREFLLCYPNIRVSLIQRNADDVRKLMKNRKVDIALLTVPVIEDDIEWIELQQEKMGIIMSESHPLAGQKQISIRDLSNEYFLCNTDSSDVWLLTKRFCNQAGFEPKIHFDGDFMELIGESVSRGQGVSFITKRAFEHSRRDEGETYWSKHIVFRQVYEEYCCRDWGFAMLKPPYFSQAAGILYRSLYERFCASTDDEW